MREFLVIREFANQGQDEAGVVGAGGTDVERQLNVRPPWRTG